MTGDKRMRTTHGAFSIAEITVVLAIFIILVGLFMDIFVRTSQQGRQLIVRQQLEAEARFAMEAVARAARTYTIDYAGYGGTLPAMPITTLRLLNSANPNLDKVIIQQDSTDANCYNDGKSFPCLRVSTDLGTTFQPLTPKNTKIESLSFFLSPSTDPYLLNTGTGTYSTSSAPLVLINFAVRGLGIKTADEWVYRLQTAITPRVYAR